MTIREELSALQRKTKSLLKPERVVDWARSNPQSSLHSAFEWNNTKAADEYRLWQARHLIAVHVINKEGVRQMISLTIDRTGPGGGYRSLDDVLAVKSLREIMLADALAELERVRLKYETLSELSKVWTEIDNARSRQTRRAKRSGSKLNQERPRPATQA